MALRFILLRSPDPQVLASTATRAARASGLTAIDGAGEFAVLANGTDEVLPMPGGGVVIGRLFDRHGPPEAIRQLEASAAEAIRKSNGGHLIERYWGGYVAAFDGPGDPRVLRAPMGALPCYHLRAGNLRIFASDPDILCRAGLLEPRIAWPGVQRQLFLRDLPFAGSALEGLSELLPGTSIALADNGDQVEQCWSPWDHVGVGSDFDKDHHAERLQRVVRQCISAWASCFSHVLLSVSGGLDSSIVAATLAGRKHRLSCVTLATDDPSGDERYYARVLASHCGADLTERRYSLERVDLDCSVAGHLPRPCGRIHELAFRGEVGDIAAARGCDAYFTGNGGDNVFYNSASARPIADRYFTHGLGPEVIRTLRDVCAVTGAGAWEAIRETRRVLRANGSGYHWRTDPLFLHPHVIEQECKTAIEHPWLNAPVGSLPGKAGHIAMLLRMQHHLDGYDRGLGFSIVNPLASQPVVETCLAIPSWVMCEGGINRAVARAAFAPLLPPEILDRRSKAGPDSFIVHLLTSRLPEIRERLLDGELASRGILDRDALSLSLSLREGSRRKAAEYMRVMALLDTEAWIGHWAHQCRTRTDAAWGPLS